MLDSRSAFRHLEEHRNINSPSLSMYWICEDEDEDEVRSCEPDHPSGANTKTVSTRYQERMRKRCQPDTKKGYGC
jgi:hypothetical protein